MLVIALAIVASEMVAMAPAGAVAPCRSAAKQATVAENRQARLFRWVAPYPASGSGSVVWLEACFKASGRTFRLAVSENGFDFYDDFGSPRLSGRFVAWYAEARAPAATSARSVAAGWFAA